MSDVRWEPIPPGEAVDYDMTIGSNSELRVVTELGEMVVEFDDDVRLCRAVPVTWSQEPPPLGTDCAVGWWEGDEWGYEFITVTQDTLLFRDGSEWFAPITVPQPPGKVGP